MTLLSPWFLAALPAVGLPVLIHLLNRGKPKRIAWAAMRFLEQAFQQHRKKVQLRDLLLLVLRCLLILLLLLLFLRPAIWTHDSSLADIRSPATVMFVLDASASMGQSDGRRSAFESARQAALDALSRLGAGSRAGLLLATDRVIPVVPRPTENLEMLRARLLDATPTSEASNLAPALERALDEVGKFPGERRLVLVFTDAQAPAWQQRDSVLHVAEKHSGTGIDSPRIEPSGQPNLAVTRVTMEPARPTVGETVNVRAEIANYSPESRAGVRVTVATNGGAARGETTLPPIEPQKVAVTELAVSFPEAGLHSLTVQIAPDPLPVDDARSKVLAVGKRVEAVVAASSTHGSGAGGGVPFLLAGVRAALGDRAVREVAVSAIDPSLLETISAVFLAAPSRVSPPAWDALREFVERGGVLAIFPDEVAGLGNSPATLWLPALVGAEEEKPLRLDQALFEHPATRAWRDPAVLPLGDIVIERWYRLSPRDDARTVIEGTAGEVLGVSMPVGRGEVVVWAFQATVRASNLVLHPFFPLLLDGVLDMAASTHGLLQDFRPGETVRFEGPAAWIGASARIEEIGGEMRFDISPPEATETGAVLTVPGIERPGAYRVVLGDDEEPVAAFAVGIDASESDLKAVEGIEIETVAGAASSEGAANRRPVELWWWLGALLVLAFFAELVLARRFSGSTA